MLLIPWLTEEFTSPLAPGELLARLQAKVAPDPTWREAFSSRKPDALFTGTVAAGSFSLHRVIGYRNSTLPQIQGWVTPAARGAGSHLRLRHRVHPLAVAFGGLFVTSLVAQGILPLMWHWLRSREFNLFHLVPFGMLAFVLVVYNVPFRLEMAQSRPLLVRLLELQETTVE